MQDTYKCIKNKLVMFPYQGGRQCCDVKILNSETVNALDRKEINGIICNTSYKLFSNLNIKFVNLSCQFEICVYINK